MRLSGKNVARCTRPTKSFRIVSFLISARIYERLFLQINFTVEHFALFQGKFQSPAMLYARI